MEVSRLRRIRALFGSRASRRVVRERGFVLDGKSRQLFDRGLKQLDSAKLINGLAENLREDVGLREKIFALRCIEVREPIQHELRIGLIVDERRAFLGYRLA